MYVLTSELDELTLPPGLDGSDSVLTIGSFDGIHVGHQALIERLIADARAQDRLAGLVTFYPHPSVVLHPQRPTLYLTTPGEKTALLEPMGLDWVTVISFTEQLADMSPRAFMQVLYDRVSLRGVWVGPDFALGSNRQGDAERLYQLGQEMGFEVHDIPYVTKDGQKVSSTHIRRLLQRGRVKEAACLLGRSYSVCGEVLHGAQRGRCLGFPTANVGVHSDRVIPANGVYATYVCLDRKRLPSVTNVGVRPTFDNGTRSVEVYILDYEGDLYGRDLVVEFVDRLRPELRFSDVQDLVKQMQQDVADAIEILDVPSPDMSTVKD
jgi:riboflavin kinase/FMN adenylyltransferase